MFETKGRIKENKEGLREQRIIHEETNFESRRNRLRANEEEKDKRA